MNDLKANQEATDWRGDIIPGCYFLRFITNVEAAVFGEVVGTCNDPDFRLTNSYSQHKTAQGLGKTHMTSVVMLLSREQFDVARQLGWPSDEVGLEKVLFVPSN